MGKALIVKTEGREGRTGALRWIRFADSGSKESVNGNSVILVNTVGKSVG